jgi:hypothetical protein
MKRVSRLICAGFGMAAVCASTSVGHAQNVISAYVTFYGFDDNASSARRTGCNPNLR